MANIPRPTSTPCKHAKHADCSGWASIDKTYGNTPCWCDCHESEDTAR